MSWQPYVLVFLLIALIRHLVGKGLRAPKWVGDEQGYIKSGAQEDPYAPVEFLRVPLLAWLSQQAHRYTRDPERALRAACGSASTMSVLASMISAHFLGGPWAVLSIGLLLALMPCRVILSRHVWPDVWLGLWLSLACLILAFPDLPPALRAPLLGTVAALAFMTRFDALLLAPCLVIGMGSKPNWQWVVILLPTVVAFVWLSVRNARRYRIPWPDNTWMFNLMVAAEEVAHPRPHQLPVERGVLRVISRWNNLTNRDRLRRGLAAAGTLIWRPIGAICGLAIRFWASIGPDRFVRERLLPPCGDGYPNISARFNRGLRPALIIVFPIFTAALALALWVAGPPPPAILWPTSAMAVGSLIHNRTRYRQAWLPGAALLLVSAAGVPGFWPALLSTQNLPAVVASIALAVALICFQVRPDVREDP